MLGAAKSDRPVSGASSGQPLGCLPLLTASLLSTMKSISHTSAALRCHAVTLTHHKSLAVGREKLCNPEQIP